MRERWKEGIGGRIYVWVSEKDIGLFKVRDRFLQRHRERPQHIRYLLLGNKIPQNLVA